MTFWSQALEIARVDLAVERRLGDSLRIVTPFAIVALIVFPLALGAQLSLIAEIGPAVFWALGVLFGMQIALRRSANDTPHRRDLYALIGLDPAAKYVGRVISGGVLMLAFLIVLYVAMLVLYSPDLPGGATWIAMLTALLFGVGLTELGTMAGEVTSGLSNRSSLASLIVAPLALPLVIGASQTLEALDRDVSILPWILLLLATDLALAVAGVALARPIEESMR